MKDKILLVDADFYKDIADELVRGAINELDKKNLSYDRISVTGALEIPAAIAIVSQKTMTNPYIGYVAVGCVIRGETSHYDIVCSESARGLMKLSIDKGLAIGNGILTVDNAAQAWARASLNKKNKGRDAVMACLSIVKLKKSF